MPHDRVLIHDRIEAKVGGVERALPDGQAEASQACTVRSRPKFPLENRSRPQHCVERVRDHVGNFGNLGFGPRADALGGEQHVRPQALASAGEHVARAAEPADHLVGHDICEERFVATPNASEIRLRTGDPQDDPGRLRRIDDALIGGRDLHPRAVLGADRLAHPTNLFRGDDDVRPRGHGRGVRGDRAASIAGTQLDP
jgi:hypothetical protein